MKRAKTSYRPRLVLAVALGFSLIGGGITGAAEAEPFASFDELRSYIHDRVAGDGRLGLRTIRGFESIGALQDLEIWPASLVVDAEVLQVEVSGPITVGGQTTEAHFEGRQMQDGSLRFSVEFDYLSLAEVTGLMERQTGRYLPADAPVHSDLELSEVKVVLQPGDDGFTVKGTTAVAGLTLDVLAAISRRDGGDNGDFSEMIVGFRAKDLNLRELGGSLAGSSLDLQLPEAVFAIRQAFHTATPAPVALSELDTVAEEYFRRAVGQDEDVELNLVAGFNLVAGIDVALLPASVVGATGMDPNDRLLLQGPIGLDLQKFVDEGSLEVASMRLAAELPGIVPPAPPEWLTEAARFQRSLVLEYVHPLASLKLIDRVDDGLDAARRYERITSYSSDGDPSSAGAEWRSSEYTGPVPAAPPTPWEPVSPLAKVIAAAGFHYDPDNDILYSRRDAWQRSFGYAWLYDVMAPIAISAVIDCEPIYFSHDDTDWMVELWKGQYGLETGGEIGVYKRGTTPADKVRYRLLDKITGTFFDAVDDAEMWEMSFVLKKGGQPLFRRGPENHWWLTGFRWGELSEPEELTMEVTIRFEDPGLRDAFIGGLERTGTGYDYTMVDEFTVRFEFDRPLTDQPAARAALREDAQANNRTLVELYDALDLESHDPNLIRSERLTSEDAREAYRLLSEHFEAVATGWVQRLAETFGGDFESVILERMNERREHVMQNLRDRRDRTEARRAETVAALQSALDLLKQPARASMEFYERRYNEAVSRRNHAYYTWQAAHPFHKPAWLASYVYWKGIASSRSAAYRAAAAVYNADIETWIANNPALAELREAREGAWRALERANVALDDANRVFSALASLGVTVHGAFFETLPGVLEDGGSVAMALDIEIGGRRQVVHADSSASDIDAMVESIVDSFVGELQS